MGCVFILPACALVPYRGYVVDSETKAPVKDVVVFIEFIAPNSFLAEGRSTVDASEGKTDEKGYFSVPDKGWSLNPWKMLFMSSDLTIFKSEYVPIQGTWSNLKDETYEPYISKAKVVWKVEYGKPYIVLRKYKNLEEMVNDRTYHGIMKETIQPGSDVKGETWKFLGEELNKEHKMLFPYK